MCNNDPRLFGRPPEIQKVFFIYKQLRITRTLRSLFLLNPPTKSSTKEIIHFSNLPQLQPWHIYPKPLIYNQCSQIYCGKPFMTIWHSLTMKYHQNSVADHKTQQVSPQQMDISIVIVLHWHFKKPQKEPQPYCLSV